MPQWPPYDAGIIQVGPNKCVVKSTQMYIRVGEILADSLDIAQHSRSFVDNGVNMRNKVKLRVEDHTEVTDLLSTFSSRQPDSI
jgi:hypothetical protein